MTQPTSVDMTFDTSLVDLKQVNNTSFSTTESDATSEFGTHPTISKISTITTTTTTTTNPTSSEDPTHSTPTQSSSSSRPTHHLPTRAAYNQWAPTYDTDGNMLQSIDSSELSILLPTFLSLVISTFSSPHTQQPFNILDLGCGTGRVTSKLLRYPYPAGTRVRVVGMDFSPAMLDIARDKLGPLVQRQQQRQQQQQQQQQQHEQSIESLHLECRDCFALPSSSSTTSTSTPPASQHAILSTLVLEHIPLSSFFSTIASLLRDKGYALISNMHPEMGATSQAGFVCPATSSTPHCKHGGNDSNSSNSTSSSSSSDGSIKIRAGNSFIYSVEQTVGAARKAGLEVVSVKERGVTKEDVERGVVGVRGGKWIGTKVWYGIIVRKVE